MSNITGRYDTLAFKHCNLTLMCNISVISQGIILHHLLQNILSDNPKLKMACKLNINRTQSLANLIKLLNSLLSML